MFLPVLMVRDYGIAGFIVFAIPNCIGAAAMGWILSRPGLSERIVAEHRTACVAFSAVTLAFHAYFLTWLARRVIPIEACIAAVVVGSALVVIARQKKTVDLAVAWLVLGISLSVLVRGLMHFGIGDRHGIGDPRDLFFLAPVCIFGFVLCPYLDLTFHRARQDTNALGAKIAFSLGFCLFFLFMIFLTLLYEGDFVWGHFGSFGAAGLRTWVAVHIAAQTAFTWAAHLRAQPALRRHDIPIWIVAAVLAGVGGVIVWTPRLQWLEQPHSSMLTGEAIYRILMGFYGLVFPAYVWICMIPFGGKAPGASRRAVGVFAATVILAGPFFYLGFVQGRMVNLAVGLAIVLLARVAVLNRRLVS